MTQKCLSACLTAMLLAGSGVFSACGATESCIVSGDTTRGCAEASWLTVQTFDTWFEEFAWQVFDPFRLDGRQGLMLIFR